MAPKKNPYSKQDAVVRPMIRAMMDDIKSVKAIYSPFGADYSGAGFRLKGRGPNATWEKRYTPVLVKGRSIGVLMILKSEWDNSPYVLSGYYSPEERLLAVTIQPGLLGTRDKPMSELHKFLSETLRHELEHATQPWSADIAAFDPGHRPTDREEFLRQIMSRKEVEAYATGMYHRAKKIKRSFWDLLDERAEKVTARFKEVVQPGEMEEWQRQVGEYAMKRYPNLKRAKNPIGKRLDYVRKQYKPEVFELTQEFVAHALKVSPEEIDPDRREEWESSITWLATQINRLLKARDKGGANIEHELRVLKRSYLDTVKPFFGRVKRKGVQRPELAQLSPQEARKYGARQAEGRFEKKQSQAEEAGYRIVKNLGGGYVAVEGMPNLNAPPSPLALGAGMEPTKQWAEENAKFQQWLGVTMRNCLQIYEVNYVAYGYSKFEVQRRGGKLYAILDPQGKPVVATLTNAKGQVIETNGPNNQPPPESAQPYLEKFEQAMGWVKGAKTNFIAPEELDKRLTSVIWALLDSDFLTEDLRARRRFIRKAQGYARQAGADLSEVWGKFAVYILEESQYSVLNTAHQSKGKTQEHITLIQSAARGYRNRTGRDSGLDDISERANELASAKNYAMADAMESVSGIVSSNQRFSAWDNAGYGTKSTINAAAHIAAEGVGERWSTAWSNASWQMRTTVAQDFAEKLLSLMREAASDAGRNLQQGAPRPNPRRRTNSAIAQCQANWDHYCARPCKKRLKAVLDHLEVMGASKSVKVRQERRRCLRIASSEAKELGV